MIPAASSSCGAAGDVDGDDRPGALAAGGASRRRGVAAAPGGRLGARTRRSASSSRPNSAACRRGRPGGTADRPRRALRAGPGGGPRQSGAGSVRPTPPRRGRRFGPLGGRAESRLSQRPRQSGAGSQGTGPSTGGCRLPAPSRPAATGRGLRLGQSRRRAGRIRGNRRSAGLYPVRPAGRSGRGAGVEQSRPSEGCGHAVAPRRPAASRLCGGASQSRDGSAAARPVRGGVARIRLVARLGADPARLEGSAASALDRPGSARQDPAAAR